VPTAKELDFQCEFTKCQWKLEIRIRNHNLVNLVYIMSKDIILIRFSSNTSILKIHYNAKAISNEDQVLFT